MQPIDSAFFNEAWAQERKRASLKKEEKDPALWEEFWDQFAPTYQKICRALIPLNRELVESWKREGLLKESYRVLDIGCGPGTFALPLGEVVREVTALDTSERMLRILKKEAEERESKNLKLLKKDWEDIEEEKTYDLVLASNSPAIYNQKTLEKMNRVSRKNCLYICYAGGLRPPLRNLLWKEIMGEELQGRTFSITFPFAILYHEGYYPHLTFQRQDYSYQEEACRIFENYRAYFRIFGREGREVDKILERIIFSKAHKGLINEKFCYRIGILSWSLLDRERP